MKTPKKLTAIASVAAVGLLLGFLSVYFGIFANKATERLVPPQLTEVSNLTGSTALQSSYTFTDNQIGSNPLCDYGASLETIPAERDFFFMYRKNTKTFSQMISQIKPNDGRFRFINFGTYANRGVFRVNPLSYFEAAFNIDLNQGGFCCSSLDSNAQFAEHEVLIVYNEKDTQICANPTTAQMLNPTTLNVNRKGWHLLWIGGNTDFNLPAGTNILAVWSPNVTASSAPTLVWDAQDGGQIPAFLNDVYWIYVDEPNFDSAMPGVPGGGNNQGNNQGGNQGGGNNQGGGDITIYYTENNVGNISGSCVNSVYGDAINSNFVNNCNPQELAQLGLDPNQANDPNNPAPVRVLITQPRNSCSFSSGFDILLPIGYNIDYIFSEQDNLFGFQDFNSDVVASNLRLVPVSFAAFDTAADVTLSSFTVTDGNGNLVDIVINYVDENGQIQSLNIGDSFEISLNQAQGCPEDEFVVEGLQNQNDKYCVDSQNPPDILNDANGNPVDPASITNSFTIFNPDQVAVATVLVLTADRSADMTINLNGNPNSILGVQAPNGQLFETSFALTLAPGNNPMDLTVEPRGLIAGNDVTINFSKVELKEDPNTVLFTSEQAFAYDFESQVCNEEVNELVMELKSLEGDDFSFACMNAHPNAPVSFFELNSNGQSLFDLNPLDELSGDLAKATFSASFYNGTANAIDVDDITFEFEGDTLDDFKDNLQMHLLLPDGSALFSEVYDELNNQFFINVQGFNLPNEGLQEYFAVITYVAEDTSDFDAAENITLESVSLGNQTLDVNRDIFTINPSLFSVVDDMPEFNLGCGNVVEANSADASGGDVSFIGNALDFIANVFDATFGISTSYALLPETCESPEILNIKLDEEVNNAKIKFYIGSQNKRISDRSENIDAGIGAIFPLNKNFNETAVIDLVPPIDTGIGLDGEDLNYFNFVNDVRFHETRNDVFDISEFQLTLNGDLLQTSMVEDYVVVETNLSIGDNLFSFELTSDNKNFLQNSIFTFHSVENANGDVIDVNYVIDADKSGSYSKLEKYASELLRHILIYHPNQFDEFLQTQERLHDDSLTINTLVSYIKDNLGEDQVRTLDGIYLDVFKQNVCDIIDSNNLNIGIDLCLDPVDGVSDLNLKDYVTGIYNSCYSLENALELEVSHDRSKTRMSSDKDNGYFCEYKFDFKNNSDKSITMQDLVLPYSNLEGCDVEYKVDEAAYVSAQKHEGDFPVNINNIRSVLISLLTGVASLYDARESVSENVRVNRVEPTRAEIDLYVMASSDLISHTRDQFNNLLIKITNSLADTLNTPAINSLVVFGKSSLNLNLFNMSQLTKRHFETFHDDEIAHFVDAGAPYIRNYNLGGEQDDFYYKYSKFGSKYHSDELSDVFGDNLVSSLNNFVAENNLVIPVYENTLQGMSCDTDKMNAFAKYIIERTATELGGDNCVDPQDQAQTCVSKHEYTKLGTIADIGDKQYLNFLQAISDKAFEDDANCPFVAGDVYQNHNDKLLEDSFNNFMSFPQVCNTDLFDNKQTITTKLYNIDNEDIMEQIRFSISGHDDLYEYKLYYPSDLSKPKEEWSNGYVETKPEGTQELVFDLKPGASLPRLNTPLFLENNQMTALPLSYSLAISVPSDVVRSLVTLENLSITYVDQQVENITEDSFVSHFFFNRNTLVEYETLNLGLVDENVYINGLPDNENNTLSFNYSTDQPILIELDIYHDFQDPQGFKRLQLEDSDGVVIEELHNFSEFYVRDHEAPFELQKLPRQPDFFTGGAFNRSATLYWLIQPTDGEEYRYNDVNLFFEFNAGNDDVIKIINGSIVSGYNLRFNKVDDRLVYTDGYDSNFSSPYIYKNSESSLNATGAYRQSTDDINRDSNLDLGRNTGENPTGFSEIHEDGRLDLGDDADNDREIDYNDDFDGDGLGTDNEDYDGDFILDIVEDDNKLTNFCRNMERYFNPAGLLTMNFENEDKSIDVATAISKNDKLISDLMSYELSINPNLNRHIVDYFEALLAFYNNLDKEVKLDYNSNVQDFTVNPDNTNTLTVKIEEVIDNSKVSVNCEVYMPITALSTNVVAGASQTLANFDSEYVYTVPADGQENFVRMQFILNNSLTPSMSNASFADYFTRKNANAGPDEVFSELFYPPAVQSCYGPSYK